MRGTASRSQNASGSGRRTPPAHDRAHDRAHGRSDLAAPPGSARTFGVPAGQGFRRDRTAVRSPRRSRQAVSRRVAAVPAVVLAMALVSVAPAAAAAPRRTPAPASPVVSAVPAERTGPGVWGDQGDGTYRNPVLNADYSDPDVIRVGSDYYLVSSEFHFMGMTILHSKDLVNWSYLGRVYDHLDISPYYDTPAPSSDPNTRYGKGSWAPALRYHAGRFWIYFCTPTEGCYMTTAKNPAGPWAPLHAIKVYAPGEHPWEDPCPFWDDDGKAYLGHSLKGAGPIIINRMSADGRTLLDAGTTVYTGPNAEGTKIYKRHGHYYLIIPQNGVSAGDQWVLRSDGIDGPYTSEAGKAVLHAGNGVNGPHQGGLVDTPSGQWWFMHFQENGAAGRVVWLEPAAWTKDDWLRIGVDANGDGVGEPVLTYPKPDTGRAGRITAPATDDDFTARRLGLQWEWNHNPDDAHWSLSARPGYLRLEPVGAVSDAYLARNTATQKLLGRSGTATTELDTSGMVDGQDAGLLHISGSAQWVGVERGGGVRRIKAVIGGTAIDGPALTGDRVWLRTTIDLDGATYLLYSLDGIHFTRIGGPLTLSFANWKGDKVGLFSDNAAGTGGKADFAWFHYTHDGPAGGAPRTDVAPAYTFAGPASYAGGTYTDAGKAPYGQASELTVAFTMRANRRGEMVPVDKLPATGSGASGGWSVALHADGSLDWLVGGADAPAVVHVADAYTPGRDVQVACTLAVGADGVPAAAVYVDGVRRAYVTHVNATVMNTGTPLRLGAPSTVNRDRAYDGTLSGVRIWRRALTAAQVRTVLPDTTPPVLRVRDVRAPAPGRVALGRALVADANAVTVTSDAPGPYYRYPAGTTAVTWTATDAAGNTTTAVQKVVVG